MNRPKYLLVALLLASPVLGWVGLAHAQSFRSGTNVTVPERRTVNSTLFASGRTIDIAGTVNGDVFCAGQDVTVSGTVNGDVICAGQTLSVTGTVSGDVRLAGQDVTLSARVGGNATVAAQSFTEQSSGNVAGDLSVGGQDATLNGTIGRDVAATGNTLSVAGQVGRNLQANVEQVNLNDGARVAGNLSYTSRHTVQRDSGAVVTGRVSHTTPKEHHRSWMGVGWLFMLYLYLSFVLIALVLVLLVPRVFHAASTLALQHLGKTVLVGLVASIVVPVLLVALLFTVVGIPLALLLGLMWLLMVLLAGPFAAYLLGRQLLRNENHAVWIMLLGAAVLFLLYFVPILGGIIWLVALWFGLGMMLLLARRIGRPSYVTAAVPVAATPAPKRTRPARP